MKWSFRIAQIAGIDIRIHVTFFLIIVIGAAQWSAAGVPGMAFGALLMLLLFLCVTLHELGHSLVAQRFGIPVRQIVLLPIGGVAMLGRNPTRPIQELLIAVAGPAVNVVILGVLLLVVRAIPAYQNLTPEALLRGGLQPSVQTLLFFLINANVWLAVFNMIPAFPMDGGRVLRGLLGFFMPFSRATRIAATIGQMLAVAMAAWGFMAGNFILVLIAFFIFTTAGAESVEGQARTVLATRRVGDAYNKYALTLTADDRVSRVVDYLLTSYQPDFAVLQGRRLIGVVTRDDVLKWLADNHYDVYVTEILHENVERVDARMSLEDVRERLREKGVRLAAVFDGDVYLGLVSAEDIAEAYMVLSFLSRQVQGGTLSMARATGA